MNVPTVIIIPDLECGEYAGGGAEMAQADIGAGGVDVSFGGGSGEEGVGIGAVFEEYERFCGVSFTTTVTPASSLVPDS